MQNLIKNVKKYNSAQRLQTYISTDTLFKYKEDDTTPRLCQS